jgi:uncharacterized tellurite resistance protein B-like protein
MPFAMLELLRDLFGPRPPAASMAPDRRLVAAAALLVEAARLDGRFEAAERERIREVLQGRLGLAPEVALELLEAGERASEASVDWHGFTQAVKTGFDYEGRLQVIEMLWEVAYADGHLHDFEASLLRRVTGLLYVGDGDSGAARRRVMRRLGIEGPA